jgi:sialic acid synthase SpsE/mannose-6-phosphate isomerase-like protein (cupin superfamily)
MNFIQLNTFSNTNPLIVLDLANNHNGSVSHGKRIIDEIHDLKISERFTVAIKFQYRNLQTFIHKDFRDRRDLKYVDRFLSTALSWDELKALRDYVSEAGFLAACTPFDEHSVERIKEHEFDILKIASASFTDWPLIEAVTNWEGPVIASTAGANLNDVDRVVSFFTNRNSNYAIMHCVASYPTTNEHLLLNRIRALKNRYPKTPVGYSTHEDPSNYSAGPMALACGATILERHVGSEKDGSPLNGYSSRQSQLIDWIKALESSAIMLGAEGTITVDNSEETVALSGLSRYAFAARDIEPGEQLGKNDIYFSIPGEPGQFQANDFGKYRVFETTIAVSEGEPITRDNSLCIENESQVFEIRNKVLDLAKQSGIRLPLDSTLEISHHYGIEKFDEYGICMITLVNRDYCKKLIFMLPGQTHPPMFHNEKDETFFLLFGDLELKLDGELTPISEGASVLIRPGVVHEFASSNGAVFEEVSSTHAGTDSIYLDEAVNRNPNRKSFIRYWLHGED